MQCLEGQTKTLRVSVAVLLRPFLDAEDLTEDEADKVLTPRKLTFQ